MQIEFLKKQTKNKQQEQKKQEEYSQLSLSRPRLSGITTYLEVKIWSLF